jgi:hypothetical protein
MKNRAKCLLCLSIVESFFEGDICSCKCGEITVYDGDAMRVEFRDIKNFVRVDDIGNEIVVAYKDKEQGESDKPQENNPLEDLTRADLIEELDRLIESHDNLPDHAKRAPVSGYDFISLMLLVSNILKRG